MTFEARDAQTNAVVGTPDSVRIFRFTSVVIVIGGRTQVPSDPPDPDSGVFMIGRHLYANEGYDVHMYAENEQITAGENRGTGAAYNEVVNGINNRRVNYVAVIGFSWGGGATFNLVERLVADTARGLIQNPFAVAFTGYIDAIIHGSIFPPQSQTQRPPNSQFHVNYFQRRGPTIPVFNVILGGNNVPGSNFELNVNTTEWGANLQHEQIDNSLNVRNDIQVRFLQNVNR